MEAISHLSLFLALILGLGGIVIPRPASESQERLSLSKIETSNLSLVHSHIPIAPVPYALDICVGQSEIDEQDNDTFEKPLSLPSSELQFTSISVVSPLFPVLRDRVITGSLTASSRLRC